MLEFERQLNTLIEVMRDGNKKEIEKLTREFNTPIQNIVDSQWVTSNCSAIVFINYTPLSVVANGNIQVNNYILQPGGFFGISGNNSEINTDRYNVVFDSAATNCVIIKKLYVQR